MRAREKERSEVRRSDVDAMMGERATRGERREEEMNRSGQVLESVSAFLVVCESEEGRLHPALPARTFFAAPLQPCLRPLVDSPHLKCLPPPPPPPPVRLESDTRRHVGTQSHRRDLRCHGTEVAEQNW